MTGSTDYPRCVFLMRHAQHRGHLTVEGASQVRSIASRFAEWLLAEWREAPERSVRLWRTNTASEVWESADLFTDEVLSEAARVTGEHLAFPFSGDLASPAGHARQDWMTQSIPADATDGKDPAAALSAYSPEDSAFASFVAWLD